MARLSSLLTWTGAGLVGAVALVNLASAQLLAPANSPSSPGESKSQLAQTPVRTISEETGSLEQQQRLAEAIKLWQRAVDSFGASAGAGAVSKLPADQRTELALALRGLAMLHRLDGDTASAVRAIAQACSFDANHKAAQSFDPSSLSSEIGLNAWRALQTPPLSGDQPKDPVTAARLYQQSGEAFAAEDKFGFAHGAYRRAFNLLFALRGKTHPETVRVSNRLIELAQLSADEFANSSVLEYEAQMYLDPKELVAPKGSKLPSMFVSPDQGTFAFKASAPVLLGKANYQSSFCGVNKEGYGSNLPEEDTLENVVLSKVSTDGVMEVQLRVRDGKNNFTYRFHNVLPAVPTEASLEGNCALPRVTVTYRPTNSNLCVYLHEINQTAQSIAADLVKVTGISVQGIALLSDKKIKLNGEFNARSILHLLSHETMLDLKIIDKTHFEFVGRPKGL